MSGDKASTNLSDKARRVLQSAWNEVVQIPAAKIDTTCFTEEPYASLIKQLINGRTKSFRYAVLTQILAKAADHRLNCLAVQAGAHIDGAFDARSLCKKVVVPFEREYLRSALGGSGDPYVSKPLRRMQISMDQEVVRQIKHKEEWECLFSILNAVEKRDNPEFTQQILKQILLEIRKLMTDIEIDLPEEIGTEQIRAILIRYLSRASLGMGPQAVAYSLLKVFNRKISAYKEVASAAPTAADAPTGRVADIECRDENGAIQLAVSVTQRLDDQKLHHELIKCRKYGANNILFLAFNIVLDRREVYRKAAQYGVNAAIADLVDFVLTIAILLNSGMRKELIVEVQTVLQEWGGSHAKREFTEIVREILEITQ